MPRHPRRPSRPDPRRRTSSLRASRMSTLTDSEAIRADQQSSIAADAQFLNAHSNIQFTVEGHCDERGSTEYNLALGDRRASSVKLALTTAGVNASRIKT